MKLNDRREAVKGNSKARLRPVLSRPGKVKRNNCHNSTSYCQSPAVPDDKFNCSNCTKCLPAITAIYPIDSTRQMVNCGANRNSNEPPREL